MLSFHTPKDKYVGYFAVSYSSLGGDIFRRGFTLNFFIRQGCWRWGLEQQNDGWGAFCVGPLFQICWDNGQ